MNLLEYWKEFSAVVLYVVTFFAGRKSNEIKEKTEGAGAIAALQSVYDAYIEHSKTITKELLNRVNSIEKHNRELQKSFNDISLSYSNVMDENRRMDSRYKELQKDYELLRIAHDKLNQEFNEYKRKIKIVR